MSPASATSRLLALLVDALVLLAAGLVGWALLDSQVLAAMTAVEALAVLTLVRAVTGRSPGALATRTAMVRAGTQTAPGLWPALARQALLVALGLTVLGPVVTVALSRDGRDWVDRLVGTGAVDLRERHDPTPQEVLVNIPTSQGVPEPQASPALAWQGPSHPGRPVGPGSLVAPSPRPGPAARPFLPEPVVPLSPTSGGLPSPVPQSLSPTSSAPSARPEAAASPEPVPDEEPAPTVGPAPVVGPEPDAGLGLDAGLAPSTGPVPVAEPVPVAGPIPTAGLEPDVPPIAAAPQDPAAQLPAETPPAPTTRQPGPVRPPQLAPVAPSLPEPVEQPTPVLQPLPLVSAPSSASPAAPAPGTPDDAPSEPEQAPPASGTPDDAPDLAQTPDDDADVPADHDVAPEPEQAPLHDQEHSAPSPQDPPLDPAPAPISGSSPAAAPLAAQEPREEPDADQAHRSPAQAPTQAGPIPYLVVDSGERLPVDDTVLVLGRAPSTSDPGQRLVTLSDPTRSLSRTHLRVGCSKHGVWVEDAFSANGTHVRMRDGASYFLPRGERVEVPFGTVLLLGERRLTITTDLPRNQ